jgi:hypothetical protein
VVAFQILRETWRLQSPMTPKRPSTFKGFRSMGEQYFEKLKRQYFASRKEYLSICVCPAVLERNTH